MKASNWLIPEEDPGPLLGQGLPDAVQGPGVAPLGDIEAVRLHPGLDHVRGEDRQPAEDTCEPARPELLYLTSHELHSGHSNGAIYQGSQARNIDL